MGIVRKKREARKKRSRTATAFLKRGAARLLREARAKFPKAHLGRRDLMEAMGYDPALSRTDSALLIEELERRGDHPPVSARRQSLAAFADVGSTALLQELRRRGGHPGAVAEAVLLCARKSADYNQGMGHEDMHRVDRSDYFPLGLASYAQMLHTKSMRLVSLARKGGGAIHESARDTMLDIVNYAGFGAAALEDEEGDVK